MQAKRAAERRQWEQAANFRALQATRAAAAAARKRKEEQEAEQRRKAEEERKQQEELAAKRTQYDEICKRISEQERIIAENRGWFGAQAKARKAAQQQLAQLQARLAREFPNGRL